MWPAIVFGWPAILVAIGLAVTGILRGKLGWLLVAAILLVPISLYLTGSPRFRLLGLSILLLLSGTSIAVYYDRTKIAWILLAPVLGIFGWLAIVVLSE